MTVSITGNDVDFTTTAADQARVENEITTTEVDKKVSFEFTVGRNPLTLRVGSASGDQDIVADLAFPPGSWVVTFTPGVSPYFVQLAALVIGKATLRDFARLAPGRLTLDTPWDGAEAAQIRTQQSLNVVWAAHRSYETRVIERRGATSWGVRLYQPSDGPFDGLNATSYSLTPSALTGEVTITANGPVFTQKDAGMLLRLTHSGQFQTETVATQDDATESIRVTGIEQSRRFYYTVSGTFSASIVLERSVGNEVNWETVTTVTAPVSTSLNDEFDNQIIYYRLRCSAYTSGSPVLELRHSQGFTDGVARIVSISADNTVTADVITPFSKTTATPLWYMGSWSARQGWPNAVGMIDGRLAFGRNDQYFLSVADDYESMRIGAEDADAISRTLTGQMNAISWLKGVDQLVAGTIGAEHRITSGALTEILTPTTTFSRAFGSRGSADIDAISIDNAIAFISRTRKRVYLATPDGDGYILTDLTRLHPDVGGSDGFVQLAFQTDPHPRLWCLRADGTAAILALDPVEQIAAWMRYVMPDASINSIAIAPRGTEDAVYFVTDRGGDNLLIERLADEAYSDIKDAWRLQAAVSYSGTATATITGLDHLDGEVVYAWGNGRQSGPYTVASGEVTLDYDVTSAIVGKKYDGRYKGPRMDFGGPQGTALTMMRKITGLGLLLHRTPGGMLKWGRSFDAGDLHTLEDRIGNGLTFDAAVQEQTIDEWFQFSGETARDPRLHLIMDGAGPATVLGVVPKVETNDR